MSYQAFRDELSHFYLEEVDERAEKFRREIYAELDQRVTDSMTGYQRKVLQYETIAERCSPVLFAQSPFYYELGSMSKLCDGAGDFHGTHHAGGWNYDRYSHKFIDQNPELWKTREAQSQNLLYLICGPYADTRQHFYFNSKVVLHGGLRSLYENATAQLEGRCSDEEKDFLEAVCRALLCMKRISEKFSQCAEERLAIANDEEEIRTLKRIADSAMYTPWNAPRTFYEALNTLAFLRTIPGALEGIGYNSFGRMDVELYPFYVEDLKAGTLTKAEAYDLIAKFLLTWDCHYDHDMKMVGYADHELENTYTLGGCDIYGKPVWNDVTENFIRATREEKIIFPKLSVRFSESSPKAYLDAVNEDVIRGTSAVLYQNDDSSIPAMVRAGYSLEDARNYIVTGCWQLLANGCVADDEGNYINLIKPFEFSVHNLTNKMEECQLYFDPLDQAETFEDVYAITIENFRRLFKERNRMTHMGKSIWTQIDPLPLTSAAMEDCLLNRRDLTAGGCKYHHETYTCAGFPNVVDSLLAIQELCFTKKEVTLRELLHAVRNNWVGNELLRIRATRCPGWGDGSKASTELAERLNSDLYAIAMELETLWPGGRIQLGHLTYTEIRFWAEKTLATPDGRRNGEYFAQGLTPSRLHKISCVSNVINSLDALDSSKLPGNSVVNIILPSTRMTLDICESYLRAMAKTGLQCLQLNCTTKEELLDAQIHPERHRDLIVRVCGFSARFTALSPEWQQEVLTRNFYD